MVRIFPCFNLSLNLNLSLTVNYASSLLLTSMLIPLLTVYYRTSRFYEGKLIFVLYDYHLI